MNILGTRLALGALLEKPLGDCLNIDRSPFRGGHYNNTAAAGAGFDLRLRGSQSALPPSAFNSSNFLNIRFRRAP